MNTKREPLQKGSAEVQYCALPAPSILEDFYMQGGGAFYGWQFNYSSVLAPHMRHLLDIKTSSGISAQRRKWMLKEFDDCANAELLAEPYITEIFIKKWKAMRVADCDRTLYTNYSVWSQLTTLMSRCECPCFIPCLPKEPKPDFTPCIFTL